MLTHDWWVAPFRLGIGLTALSLVGCASFSPDAGMSVVSGIAATALGQEARRIDMEQAADAARIRVRRILTSPLSAESAAQIALFNNKGLQAAYNGLGIAEAARVEASLPPNPTFSLSRISTSVELDVERRLVGDILALATLPARSEIAADRFRQAQLDAARETLRIGLETQRAWYRAVASRQLAAFLEQASQAAETSAQLATDLGRTGALNKLDQAREQSFHLELSTQLATARRADGKLDRANVLVESHGTPGAIIDCSQEATLKPQIGTSSLMMMTIVNRTGGDIDLFNLSPSGDRYSQSLGPRPPIADGQSMQRMASPTAPLVVTDGVARTCLEIILPGDSTRTVVIRPKGASPRSAVPLPGTEDLLRQYIDGVRRGALDDQQMTPWAADLAHRAIGVQRTILAKLGAVQTVTFVGIGPAEDDIYRVKFDNGTVEWRVDLSSDRKIRRSALGPQ